MLCGNIGAGSRERPWEPDATARRKRRKSSSVLVKGGTKYRLRERRVKMATVGRDTPRPEWILYERDAFGSPDRNGYYMKGTPSAAPTGMDII